LDAIFVIVFIYERDITMRTRRGFLGSMSGGIFLIFLALAFIVHGYFLPLLFVGLAFSSLFGSLSSRNPKGAYGGIQGVVWMLGLALCFAVGFWPWIMLVVAASIILGAFAAPIMAALAGLAFFGIANMTQAPPTYQQPYYPSNQPPPQPYESYQQGYQPPPAPPRPQESYQEGGQQHPYPSPQQYDQPQTQYPQQMPPQQ
jgi:hypothetical protein